ncbi:hypothetical protein NKH84_29090 [Mesorhizobium sp. M0902]|uniref:hypothetical protein n=1 Tax=Mesorhizobium sp. M0902 TaxID=2957021 RepID=UPI0033366D08
MTIAKRGEDVLRQKMHDYPARWVLQSWVVGVQQTHLFQSFNFAERSLRSYLASNFAGSQRNEQNSCQFVFWREKIGL